MQYSRCGNRVLRAIKGNIQVFSAKLLFKMDVKRTGPGLYAKKQHSK